MLSMMTSVSKKTKKNNPLKHRHLTIFARITDFIDHNADTKCTGAIEYSMMHNEVHYVVTYVFRLPPVNVTAIAYSS
jgi:hypothetical protein